MLDLSLIQQAYCLHWHINGYGCFRYAHGYGIDVGSGTAVRGRLFSAIGRYVYGTADHLLALGVPLAGYSIGLYELRNVDATSLLAEAACLAELSVSDFHHPNIIVSILLLVLGIALSIGLTASSIAIMNSAPSDKSGAAGSMEVISYEFGDGLGITFFGCTFDNLLEDHQFSR